jgi:ribosomal protein L36
MRNRRWVRGAIVGFTIAAASTLGAWLHRRWVMQDLPRFDPLPSIILVEAGGRTSLRYPGALLVTRVATFRDELFSYLMYEHYRNSSDFRDRKLLLYFVHPEGQPEYRVDLILSDEMTGSMQEAAALFSAGKIENGQLNLLTMASVNYYQRQSKLFEAAYNRPVQRKMEDLSAAELRSLLRRFVRFKSTTDPRIRKKIEPVPKILATNEAQRVAGDIVDVAYFYDLPLDLFLSIGAMENNYMDVRGDLKNSIWKKRAEKDDIVLERRRGRVRVLNDSAGRWQITRETLRYVHELYLKDKRDYTKLDSRLIPPQELDVNNVAPDVLTTYAGLLVRDLLDYFNGDAVLAAGAYNGGTGNPNLRYAARAQAAAVHARAILERAAALNGESVLRMRWLSPR